MSHHSTIKIHWRHHRHNNICSLTYLPNTLEGETKSQNCPENSGTMPTQIFQKGDIVIDHEKMLMGYVEKCEWAAIVHSYSYEYKCEYMTDTIENPL